MHAWYARVDHILRRMPDRNDTATEGHVLDRPHRRMYRRIGSIAGIVLVVAGAVAVFRDGAVMDSLARAARTPDLGALALLVASVAAAQVLSSAVLWVLTQRAGRVGLLEMNALVAASTLGNYVPMQAGSIGRVAYHKAVNGIAVRDSLVVIVQATVLTFVVVCVMGAAALGAKAAGLPWWSVAFVPVLWLPLAAQPEMRAFAVAAALRSVEVLAWTLHSWAAFRLSGWPVAPETALGASLVACGANLVPFVGNGLGVREWAVAAAAPILGGYERDAGLAAELVGRAVDVAVAVPLGLLAAAWLVRRVARHARGQATG